MRPELERGIYSVSRHQPEHLKYGAHVLLCHRTQVYKYAPRCRIARKSSYVSDCISVREYLEATLLDDCI